MCRRYWILPVIGVLGLLATGGCPKSDLCATDSVVEAARASNSVTASGPKPLRCDLPKQLGLLDPR